jgi:hypothetical protein
LLGNPSSRTVPSPWSQAPEGHQSCPQGWNLGRYSARPHLPFQRRMLRHCRHRVRSPPSVRSVVSKGSARHFVVGTLADEPNAKAQVRRSLGSVAFGNAPKGRYVTSMRAEARSAPCAVTVLEGKARFVRGKGIAAAAANARASRPTWPAGGVTGRALEGRNVLTTPIKSDIDRCDRLIGPASVSPACGWTIVIAHVGTRMCIHVL